MSVDNQITTIASLPLQVQKIIVSDLKLSDLFRFGLTSQANSTLIKSNAVWKEYSSDIGV